MKGYYLIKEDGSSIFELPYCEDFIYHCLILLMDRSEEQYRVLCVDEEEISASVQRVRGKGDESPLLANVESEKQKNLLTYILK